MGGDLNEGAYPDLTQLVDPPAKVELFVVNPSSPKTVRHNKYGYIPASTTLYIL
jgi:hypothetical protein